MAAGRVTTGFSKPYVALYASSGTTVTYSSCTQLARGVNVSVEAGEASNDNVFYADNQTAETLAGFFSGGTVTLTVDGLIDTTRKMILGLPAKDSDGFYHYGDGMAVPNVGIGYIARVQSDSVVSYVPTILTKAKFNVPTQAAATQEDEIDWQTEELTAVLMRDDTGTHDWKLVGEGYATEALAEAAMVAKLGGTL